MGLIYLQENLGFIINYKKSQLESTQEIEFLGFLVNPQHNGSQTSWREDQKDQIGRQETTGIGTPDCSNPLPTTREDECGHTGNHNGSPVLQEPTQLPPRGNPGITRLLLDGGSLPRSEGGASLVGGAFHQLKWTQSNCPQPINGD